MYKRLSAVMFPILLVALIGTAVWGYQEHQDKNSVLIKAENQYQRAFHDLSYYMDKLQTELGNTLAINSSSADFFQKNLINVWRLTAQAQSEINQLPLTLLPFHKTEEFLANMANFAYQTSVRDLTRKPLTQDESKTLHDLYKYSKEINHDLRDVQSKVISKHLRWMDVETALANENNKLDNTIIDGFRLVNQKVSEYPEINWGPAGESLQQSRNFQALSGNGMTPEQIKQKAANFLGLNDTSGLQITENGQGTEYHSFTVSGVLPNSNRGFQMDYSQKGGHLVWYSAPRKVGQRVLDVRGARDASLDFLESHGYPNLAPLTYEEYQNVASLTFAPLQNDVIIYPAKLTVQVAMDDGEVLGLQTTDYVYENKERNIPAPKLTVDEAKRALNPGFTVKNHSLALIRNDANEETLCYQFEGKINGGDYRIFINADNGMEEKIEPIRVGKYK